MPLHRKEIGPLRPKSYSIHGIVSFSITERTNLLHTCFSRLARAYANFETSISDPPDISISIGKFTPSNDECRIVDEKFYVKKDYLYCGVNHYKFARWAAEFTGFENQRPCVRVSPNIPAELVIQGDVISPMILFMIGEKGCSIIHGSGISKNGKAVILAGRSATGKTTLALNLVQRGYGFLGDNFVILRKGKVLAYPSLLGIFSYNLTPLLKERLGSRKRFAITVKKVLHRVTKGYVKLFTSVNPREVLDDALVKQAALSQIILLLPGQKFRASAMSREALVKHLVFNQMMDCPKFMEYALAYAYEFPDSNLARWWDRYERTLLENIPLDIAVHKVEVPPRYDNRAIEQLEEIISA
jgi:hypothetical protein